MWKKFYFISGVCLLFILAYAGYQYAQPLASKISFSSCAFCQPEVIERQTFYEGCHTRALINYKPLLPGHVLIVPKRHVERFEDLSPEEWVEMSKTIKKVQQAFIRLYQKSDYLLILQNGINAGQTVPHAHYHVIPRGNEATILTKLYIWHKFLTEPLNMRKPLSIKAQQQLVDALKKAMCPSERL